VDEYQLLVGQIEHRLTQERFKLWRKISVLTDLDTDIFASRITWFGARHSEHIFLQFRVSPTVRDFNELFEWALSYSKRAYPIPFPVQLITNYRLICVIATTNVTQELIEHVTDKPPEHWRRRIWHGYFEMPVLIDLNSGKTYYYTGVFRRSLRHIVQRMLGDTN
jgi:hypothetical protein